MIDVHPVIAREGWKYIGLVAVTASIIAVFVAWWVSIPFWLLLVFVMQFFRDPHRIIPVGEGLVVSPADGKVIQVGPAMDPLLERAAVKISVFMNVFNVHSNRAPVAGKIIAVDYRRGAYVNAALDKASEANEANALAIATSRGKVTFVQIAGLIARRICCYVGKGDELARGQRYGFIRFGSRVDVYLPEDCEIKVAPGDVVTAGIDVVAVLAETEQDTDD